MSEEASRYFVELPIPAAAQLAMDAAKHGVKFEQYLGYLVLKSSFGYESQEVVAFETRPEYGQERKG